jgi:hypothetical protein
VWTVPAYLACGLALAAVARPLRLAEPVRRGLVSASGAVQGLAVLSAAPVVAVALLGPVTRVGRIWSGAPGSAREAVAAGAAWPPYAQTAPLVLAAVAAVLALAVRDAARRPWALLGALVLGWASVLLLPPVLDVPYPAGLVALGALTAVLLAVGTRCARSAGRLDGRAVTALVLALLTSLTLGTGALATRPATLAALAVLTALFAAASRWRVLSPVTAPAALGHAAALACATGAAAGWAPQHTALLVLAVPAAAALAAARAGGVAVEVAGAVAGLLAIGLAAVDPPVLALVLSLCAVIAAGTALRPGRRCAGYAAGVLFVLAAWVRLTAWGVGTPEAYTLPVTVPALVVGALRRRRDPSTSSWAAYGPGLAATLLPGLAAAWTDPHGTRPLLLGAAALVVTLLGARHRLRAPLVLGGGVLVLDALHELAPYLVQVAGVLPRWVPPALAGLLLLAVGATYEQRLRDVRRVREVLGRMH